MVLNNYLVTGAAGFIGSNFVNYMGGKYKDSTFIVLDKMSYVSRGENLNQRNNVELVIGDIRNSELVAHLLLKYSINIVVHFAAESHVDNSFYNSISFTENNILGTHILLETCRKYNKIDKFIHMSTDEVYGEVSDNISRTEEFVRDPTNPYAASKAAAEFIVKSYHYSYNFPIIIVRCNNVIGVNQYPEKIMPRFITRLLKGEKLQIQGNGTSLRLYIHVDDVCSAIETMLEKGVIGEIYNISSDLCNEYSVLQVAEIVVNEFFADEFIKGNVEDYIEYVEDRNFNDCRYLISSAKLESLGWKPVNTDFRKTVRELILFYEKNEF
jgi:UDP-glucose 4,6-dehydratase